MSYIIEKQHFSNSLFGVKLSKSFTKGTPTEKTFVKLCLSFNLFTQIKVKILRGSQP